MLFTVAAPPERQNSAGIMCLYELMRCLKELGHEVNTFDYTKSGRWEVRGVLIVPEVFPEIAFPHVRWCLNKPGLLGGPKVYPKGVVCFHYSPELEDATRAASHTRESEEFMLGVINVPKIEAPKTHSLWYQGKYDGDLANPAPHQLQLTRTWPPTKEEYWNLLAYTKELYSYDDFSAVNLEAHLMGCKVFVNDGLWAPFEPPEYADRLLWNNERNMKETAQFVDIIKSKM